MSTRNIFVGMSGWTYEGWRGDFYPKSLVQKKELEFASRKVNSIEVNGTFYALQKPTSFQKWYSETPENFCFSVKAPQYITHIRRFKEVDEPMANFFASGLFCLKEKLGPILWQLPPNMILKDDRFEKFMRLLPHTTEEASRLAKKHSEKMNGRVATEAEANLPVRHALELRHKSFLVPEFLEQLKEKNIAVVFAHAGLKSPYTEDITADFIYARMHGQDEKFKKGYTPEVLSWWAKRVKAWTEGKQPKDTQCILQEKPKPKKRDAFIYFDTEAKEFSPYDALRLSNLLESAS